MCTWFIRHAEGSKVQVQYRRVRKKYHVKMKGGKGDEKNVYDIAREGKHMQM